MDCESNTHWNSHCRNFRHGMFSMTSNRCMLLWHNWATEWRIKNIVLLLQTLLSGPDLVCSSNCTVKRGTNRDPKLVWKMVGWAGGGWSRWLLVLETDQCDHWGWGELIIGVGQSLRGCFLCRLGRWTFLVLLEDSWLSLERVMKEAEGCGSRIGGKVA